MIKAIFFDLWDTVIYLCGSHPVVEIKKKLTLPSEMSTLEFASILEKTIMTKKFSVVEEEFSELLSAIKTQKTDSLIYNISEIWKKNIHNLYFPPVIEECLKEARKEFKLALLTNTDSFSYEFVKMRYGIEKYFDLVLASFEVGSVKPDPLMFKSALEKLSLRPEEVLMCGDSPFNDILPAKALGMKTILVDTKRIFADFKEADYTVHTIKDFVEKLKGLKTIEYYGKFVSDRPTPAQREQGYK